MVDQSDAGLYPSFDRRALESDTDFTVIGSGALGGKALGLAAIRRIIAEACPAGTFPEFTVGIPRLTVLATRVFEQFMAANNLYEVALSDLPAERIAHAFVQAELPPLVVGDLRALIARVHAPLAVRSSSLLEDALHHPFAGVYGTKMIPNNQAGVDERFRKLAEAIKYVWASTFFPGARQYMRTIGQPIENERMAVVIQEVVGEQRNGRFYPILSGVLRTHNFYPRPPGRAEDGVVNLALGLGKTIVDGGVTWTYAPRYPRHRPPFASTQDLLRNTQTRFWAVSMAPAPYDPINEAEHLVECGLDAAEWDGVLRFVASTYDAASDRLTLGTGTAGPRVLTFGPLLELGDIPLNRALPLLGERCREALGADVEIEFAMTLDRQHGLPARFGFLQVRPMLVADQQVEVREADLDCDRAVIASETVLGNGVLDSIADLVYVKPGVFEARHTAAIAGELERINTELVAAARPYLLVGFGRWGSSDPWLGIPVTWPQISGARAIVEATRPDMDTDASQGSHFFHNMISFQVQYFTVRHTAERGISWEWLDGQPAVGETTFLRHIRLSAPLEIRADGRSGRGVVLRP